MLRDYRAEHPSPLVLAGSPPLLDRFCALSRNLDRLAGRVVLPDDHTALDLALASGEAIERYLRTRRQDALKQLEEAMRTRPRDVASGIASCWRRVSAGPPGMLVVEESYICPGVPEQLSADPAGGGSPEPAPGVQLHDLVDDLMEQVILRGGQIALVRDGELAAHERVALISRPPGPGPGVRAGRGTRRA